MARLCESSKKRKFRSPGAARRSGKARHGHEVEIYRCPKCGTWHITRQGADPQLEQLVQAVLGRKAFS